MPDKALLHIILEPCVHLVDGLVPGSFRGVWVVDMFLPMEMQTPSASLVLSLAPPLGTLSLVQ